MARPGAGGNLVEAPGEHPEAGAAGGDRSTGETRSVAGPRITGVKSALDNAMDEAVAGHATWIEVHLDADGVLAVRDNGRGIPVDPHPKFRNKSALEVIMTTLHAGGKFGGKV